jgi:hypothetical protein
MYYTGTTVRFPAVKTAVKMAYKLTPGSTASVICTTVEDDKFVFAAPVAGGYRYQQYDADNNVVCTGSFTVEQSLADAPSTYDARSEAEKALEAIDAKIAGRILTLEQSHITIGDRSIQYINSISELLKWRDFYQRIVNKEQGIVDAKTEVCILKRV